MRAPWKASSLLGRLETFGPGGTAALRRRKPASQLERRWLAENSLRAQQQGTGQPGWPLVRI